MTAKNSSRLLFLALCATATICGLLVEGCTNSPAIDRIGSLAPARAFHSSISNDAYGAIDEFAIPQCLNAYCQPIGITEGPNNEIWFADYLYHRPGGISPAGSFTQFDVTVGSGYVMWGITTGPDGNLWITAPYNGNESNVQSKIVKLTPAGQSTFYKTPYSPSYPTVITAGPDGNLWIGDAGGVDRMTTGGKLVRFPLPGGSNNLEGIAAGPDGNVWFTDQMLVGSEFIDEVGKISSSGTSTEFTVPHSSGQVEDITAGPDGNLWFTDGDHIGRITTSGSIKRYAVPTTTASAGGIAVGPDKNIWFTETNGKIGRLTLASGGTITIKEFPMPNNGEQNPANIAAGSDGNMWFTLPAMGAIGRINIASSADRYHVSAIGP